LPPRRARRDAGPPRGHPASNGCVLDGTRTGFGPIDGRGSLARAAVGLRRFFGSPECPVDRDPPRPLCGRLVMVPASGSTSSHLIAARRGHVHAGGVPAIEGPFHRTRPLWALLREPAAARWAGWPAGEAAARFHRCARHRLDPVLAPLSRCEPRPRALLRLLQVDISTSTTADHPNISTRGEPRSGRLPGLERKLPSVRGSRRRFSWSGVEQDRCSTFQVAIARVWTSPRPRSSPGTWCRETLSPTGLERRGEGAALPTSSALARCARRKGGVAPALREEARR